MFITIIDNDEEFPWTPEGYSSTFTLRIVGDDVQAKFHREHTKKVLDPASRAMVPVTNWSEVSAAIVDYAIVGWSGIQGTSGQEVPCTPAMKARLPEKWKTEIVRLCAAKEGGEVAAEEKKRLSPISSGKPTA